METDVVVVGGGIAGAALATVLAREGLDVMVLERRTSYTDMVRGENLHPWGVAEAQRLGLAATLIEAGAHLVDSTVNYGDGDDASAAEERATPLGRLVGGVAGELNLAHPTACEALVSAAAAAGATVHRGVDHVEVTPGSPPVVTFRQDGQQRSAVGRLVVGADGRSSRVRRQAGIALERAPAAHLIAGLLVDGLDVAPSRNVVATGDDVWMVTFPQGGGRARIYLCPGTEDPQRFAGPDGSERFLAAAAVDSLPDAQAWHEAIPVGPCRTFPADDTWSDEPFAEGVVLLGDAAGHTNPLIGQGLALALRDVRALAEAMLEERSWDHAALADYGARSAERLRRARFLGQLHAAVWVAFGPDARARRRQLKARWEQTPELMAAVLGIFTGPESLDPRVCTPQFRRRYLGRAG